MESQWTNKYAILRDLSVAQGRQVTAEISGSIEAGQTPPTVELQEAQEETEEELHHDCIGGGGDQRIEPDLNLIKEMLDMVKQSDNGESGDTGDCPVISKRNPLSEEFVPTAMGSINENEKINNKQSETNLVVAVEVHVEPGVRAKPQKQRRKRNVAITSLLEKEESILVENINTDANASTSSAMTHGETNNETCEELKLLKPEDFITSTDSAITEAVDKVEEWLKTPVEPAPSSSNKVGEGLETPVEPAASCTDKVEEGLKIPVEPAPSSSKRKTINLSPANMFKKKNPAVQETTKRKCETSSPETPDSDAAPRQPEKVFVPSDHAEEYYKKFLERQEEQDKEEEAMLLRAEKLMKEIDDKRFKLTQRTVDATLDSVLRHVNPYNLFHEVISIHDENPVSMNIPGLEKLRDSKAVLLPQHRHELPEDCQVCLALARHGHRMDKISCGPKEISGEIEVSQDEASNIKAEKTDVTQ